MGAAFFRLATASSLAVAAIATIAIFAFSGAGADGAITFLAIAIWVSAVFAGGFSA